MALISSLTDSINKINYKTIGLVAAHADDLEINCAGTIQLFKKKGFQIIGLIIRHNPERINIIQKISKILGYKLILANLEKEETLDTIKNIIIEKLIQPYKPFLVFGHSQKDDHLRHALVGKATDSACACVPNILYFSGALRKYEFNQNVFFSFTEKEYQLKLKVLKMIEKVYGKTRYFTEQYLSENAYLGQKIYQYYQRPEAPFINIKGKKTIPYAEGFEIKRMQDPFL